MQYPLRGFPGGSLVKNLPANAGDAGDVGSIPEHACNALQSFEPSRLLTPSGVFVHVYVAAFGNILNY